MGPSLACAHVVVIAVAVAVSISLRREVPLVLNTSAYDGLLFARAARSIADGTWLGDFDDLTLIKGPGYPLFLAAVHGVGLELAVAEQVVFLLAAAALALAVLVVTRRRWLATASFVFLALDPSNFGQATADVMRDNYFASLGLLAFVVFFLLGRSVTDGRRVLPSAALAAVAGGVAGLYWITREEGITLVPPVAVLLLGAGLTLWRRRRPGSRSPSPAVRRRRTWVVAVVATSIAGATFAAPLALVRVENGATYGVQLENDMSQGMFLRAYADWSRVEAGDSQFRIPITEAQRRAVYPVSSAARALQPYLEDQSNPWRSYACPSSDCDYGGGWMVWAMRDAAASAGYFRDASTAQRFFADLSRQIDEACGDGSLDCAPTLPASLQPIQRAPLGELVSRYLGLLGGLVTAEGQYQAAGDVDPLPTSVRDEYASVVNWPPDADVAAVDQTPPAVQGEDQYRVLAVAYRTAIPALLVLAVVGTGTGTFAMLRRGAEVNPLVPLAWALLVGMLVRVFLLALVDTAEYDASLPRYQQPGYFLLLGFLVVGIAAGLTARTGGWASRRLGRRDHGSLPEGDAQGMTAPAGGPPAAS